MGSKTLDTWKRIVMSKSVLFAISLGILINAIFILLFIVAGVVGVLIFVVVLLLLCGIAGVYFAFCIKRNKLYPVTGQKQQDDGQQHVPQGNVSTMETGSVHTMRKESFAAIDGPVTLDVSQSQLVLSGSAHSVGHEPPAAATVQLQLSELSHEPLALSPLGVARMQTAHSHNKDFWRQSESHDGNDWVRLDDINEVAMPTTDAAEAPVAAENAVHNGDIAEADNKQYEDSAVQTRQVVQQSNGLEKSPTCNF